MKVAFPNFIDGGIWCFMMSFVNVILIMTMGEIGPILYSVCNKIKSLLVSPTRGYGRGLMSVTGHLFGAHKFDELNNMFKYTLKVAFITTLIEMIVFIFLREQIFALFSITGMETEIFLIAIAGTVVMLSIPFSIISSKMLDGFGKSMYSLLLTICKIVIEIALIYVFLIFNNSHCVLYGILISEIISAIVYYLFLRHLFRNFDEKYEKQSTVKTFDNEESLTDSEPKDEDETVHNKYLKRLPLIFALLALSITALDIITIPIRQHNIPLIISGGIALIIGSISVYFMEKFKPIPSIIGFIVSAIVLFVFMEENGQLPAVLFIITGVLLFCMKILISKLKRIKKS